jgi:hypothetical protein
MTAIGDSGDVPHHPAVTFVPHKNHKKRPAATVFPTFHDLERLCWFDYRQRQLIFDKKTN